MEAAAAAAEVFSILQSIGLLSAVMVLCFLVLAFWASRKAFRTGRSLKLKISPRSLEINIGPEHVSSGSQLEEGENQPELTEATEPIGEAGRDEEA